MTDKLSSYLTYVQEGLICAPGSDNVTTPSAVENLTVMPCPIPYRDTTEGIKSFSLFAPALKIADGFTMLSVLLWVFCPLKMSPIVISSAKDVDTDKEVHAAAKTMAQVILLHNIKFTF